MLSMLRQKSARVDLQDDFGQNPVHLAARTGSWLGSANYDIDPVIQSLLGTELMVECRNASDQRPLEIALARGSRSTAMTLSRANKANDVLGEIARHSIEGPIVQTKISRGKPNYDYGNFLGMREAYQPRSLLEVLEASYALQARLPLAAPRGVLAADNGAKIVSSILDFAEYWAISTADVKLGVSHLKDKTPYSASLRLGKGRVRKLEVYVARPLMQHGSGMIRYGHDSLRRSRLLSNKNEPTLQYHLPSTRRSWDSDIENDLEDLHPSPLTHSSIYYSRQPRFRERSPIHKDGALLQLLRSQPRYKSGSARAGPASVRGGSTPHRSWCPLRWPRGNPFHRSLVP